MIIVDTMVLSEPLKPNPDPSVIDWLDQQVPTDLYLTAINQAEIEYGLWAMPEGKRRAHLHRSITELFEVDFSGRILAFDSQAAIMYGTSIAPARQMHGKDAIKDMDGLIAAIAISNDRCRVATRDRRPFELMGVEVIDPWIEHVQVKEE